MYLFAAIRAASSAVCLIWHPSLTTRLKTMGNSIFLFPITNCWILGAGMPPVYSLRVNACPLTWRYILFGFLAMFVTVRT